MHHELSKYGENHKLGDVENIPTKTYTLSVCTRLTPVFHLKHFIVKLGASFICFCFSFDFYFVRPPHYLLCIRELLELLVETCCILVLYWGKGCLS